MIYYANKLVQNQTPSNAATHPDLSFLTVGPNKNTNKLCSLRNEADEKKLRMHILHTCSRLSVMLSEM